VRSTSGYALELGIRHALPAEIGCWLTSCVLSRVPLAPFASTGIVEQYASIPAFVNGNRWS